ncbi:hypothetical protein MKW92_030698 [Papaver armeniacum]|nr:hypothetical protein MKW92_030698 [Papaver armeniacum]
MAYDVHILEYICTTKDVIMTYPLKNTLEGSGFRSTKMPLMKYSIKKWGCGLNDPQIPSQLPQVNETPTLGRIAA